MFKQKAGLLKHQKYARCPLKKPISLQSEEAANYARIAKKQYITLNGRNSKTQSTCEDELIEFENYYELISDEVEMDLNTILPNEESEDWQYEYLDEALVIFTPTDEEETNPFEVIEEQKEAKCDTKKTRHKKSLYTCDFCCKQFSSRSSIITHLIKHKTIADYGCSACSQTFKTQGNLSRHFRNMHSNTKNWSCEKCGKMFREKYQLDIHMPNHYKRMFLHAYIYFN